MSLIETFMRAQVDDEHCNIWVAQSTSGERLKLLLSLCTAFSIALRNRRIPVGNALQKSGQ